MLAKTDRERKRARGIYTKCAARFDKPVPSDGKQLIWAMHCLGISPPPLDELAGDEPVASVETGVIDNA